MNTSYGTYDCIQYQTVDFKPLKLLTTALLKLLAVAFVLVALTVVGVLLFQVVSMVVTLALGWIAVHGWQALIVAGVFYGAWKVKP